MVLQKQGKEWWWYRKHPDVCHVCVFQFLPGCLRSYRCHRARQWSGVCRLSAEKSLPSVWGRINLRMHTNDSFYWSILKARLKRITLFPSNRIPEWMLIVFIRIHRYPASTGKIHNVWPPNKRHQSMKRSRKKWPTIKSKKKKKKIIQLQSQ